MGNITRGMVWGEEVRYEGEVGYPGGRDYCHGMLPCSLIHVHTCMCMCLYECVCLCVCASVCVCAVMDPGGHWGPSLP